MLSLWDGSVISIIFIREPTKCVTDAKQERDTPHLRKIVIYWIS